jgi:hypothetical protein
MILKINGFSTIGQLKDKFNECFPHLKIEFFNGEHDLKNNQPVNDSLHILDISKKHKNGEIEIKSWYKTEKVIHDFKSLFGLLVKIYRLHNNEYVALNNEKLLAEREPINLSLHSQKSIETNSATDEEVKLFL